MSTDCSKTEETIKTSKNYENKVYNRHLGIYFEKRGNETKKFI